MGIGSGVEKEMGRMSLIMSELTQTLSVKKKSTPEEDKRQRHVPVKGSINRVMVPANAHFKGHL